MQDSAVVLSSPELESLIQLLADSAYFRTKLPDLSYFEKVVGGLVWCISLFAQRLDVELLYSDNFTLGQKISQTERIAAVLPRLRCPYALEAHQIQGLDAEHILPVVRWLLEEAENVRKLRAEKPICTRVYQFGIVQGWTIEKLLRRRRQICKPLVRQSVPSALECGTKALQQPSQRPPAVPPRRQQLQNKLFKSDESGASDEEGIDYAPEGDADDDADFIVLTARGDDTDDLLLDSLRDGAVGHGSVSDKDVSSYVASSEAELERLQAELADAEDEENTLNGQLSEALLYSVEKSNSPSDIDQQIQRPKNNDNLSTDSDIDAVAVAELHALLSTRDQVKSTESAFKRACKVELERLDVQIESLESDDGSAHETSDRTAVGSTPQAPTTTLMGQKSKDSHKTTAASSETESAIRAAESQLVQLHAHLDLARTEVSRLQSRVDAQPSQLELAQYRRRFIELYKQIAGKERELRHQIALYNTLVDLADFTRRQVDLWRSIEDVRDRAARPEYKDSLLESLDQIGRTADIRLDKISSRRRMLQDQRDVLTEKLTALQERQRAYQHAVVEFQMECQQNEELKYAIAEVRK